MAMVILAKRTLVILHGKNVQYFGNAKYGIGQTSFGYYD